MADDRDRDSDPPAREFCSFCDGRLKFAAYIPPVGRTEPAHRVYRCDACGRVETFWQRKLD